MIATQDVGLFSGGGHARTFAHGSPHLFAAQRAPQRTQSARGRCRLLCMQDELARR